MSAQPAHPPLFRDDGSHCERQGQPVYHATQATWLRDEERATAAGVSVFSYANPKRTGDKAVVVLETSRDSFSLNLNLSPQDADALADALKLASEQVRAVQAILAQRAAAMAPGGAA